MFVSTLDGRPVIVAVWKCAMVLFPVGVIEYPVSAEDPALKVTPNPPPSPSQRVPPALMLWLLVLNVKSVLGWYAIKMMAHSLKTPQSGVEMSPSRSPVPPLGPRIARCWYVPPVTCP